MSHPVSRRTGEQCEEAPNHACGPLPIDKSTRALTHAARRGGTGEQDGHVRGGPVDRTPAGWFARFDLFDRVKCRTRLRKRANGRALCRDDGQGHDRRAERSGFIKRHAARNDRD